MAHLRGRYVVVWHFHMTCNDEASVLPRTVLVRATPSSALTLPSPPISLVCFLLIREFPLILFDKVSVVEPAVGWFAWDP